VEHPGRRVGLVRRQEDGEAATLVLQAGVQALCEEHQGPLVGATSRRGTPDA
jgi:hypothetical protein